MLVFAFHSFPIDEYENDSKNENELPAPVQWIDLPLDVTANILQRLEVAEILESAENVCTTWRIVCSDPAMWRVLYIKSAEFWNEGIRKLWFRAVDRSQGQLVDLTIDCSSDDDLLNCIADRPNHLKRLTLRGWSGYLGKAAVVRAFYKLPHLEELRLIDSPDITSSDIVYIGKCCPLLKSFTFNQIKLPFYLPDLLHPYAVAIPKSMPNLSHLCLITNLITNVGLEAILNGCPNLESLDLSQCAAVDLGGALGKRCSEQIKHLNLPLENDAFLELLRTPMIADYEFHDESDEDI